MLLTEGVEWDEYICQDFRDAIGIDSAAGKQYIDRQQTCLPGRAQHLVRR
jgi:hypothetical protein